MEPEGEVSNKIIVLSQSMESGQRVSVGSPCCSLPGSFIWVLSEKYKIESWHHILGHWTQIYFRIRLTFGHRQASSGKQLQKPAGRQDISNRQREGGNMQEAGSQATIRQKASGKPAEEPKSSSCAGWRLMTRDVR